MGWDKYIPGHGMLIWHIDYDGSSTGIWFQNCPNNNASHQYVDIEEANGTANSSSSSTMAGYPFPGTSRKTSFTESTTPALRNWAGTGINAPITNIAENTTTGVVTFDVCGGAIYVAPPTANATGTVQCHNPFQLTLTKANNDDVVHYMTDLDFEDNIYTGPVTINQNCELEFWSVREGKSSATTTVNFAFSAGDVTFSPAGGSFLAMPQITLSSETTGATIRYTVNGSEPTTTSTLYTAPFTPSGACTVKAKAFYGSWTPSATKSATYSITEQHNGSAEFNLYQIWNATDKTDSNWGSSYSNHSISYPEATITMTASKQTGTITDYPVMKGSEGKEILIAMEPGYEPITAASIEAQQWSSNAHTITIQYSTDGTNFTDLSGVSSSNFSLSVSSFPANVKAIKFVFSGTKQVAIKNISVIYGSAAPVVETVATPLITPAGGEVAANSTATISCSTADAVIRYTTDGSTPTATSTVYSAPIAITSAMTIKAIATKVGWNASEVASASFTIKAEETGGNEGGQGNQRIDVLTETSLNLNSSSATDYNDYTNRTLSTSSAVYYAQCAHGNSSIQLRTTNNNSGVVSTTSGGKLVKVAVKWNSNTSSGRKVEIFASNTAYETPSDLYNTSKRGTSLGTISYPTNGSIDVTGDYTYFGIKSTSGALYLDEIDVTWEVADEGGNEGGNEGGGNEGGNTNIDYTDLYTYYASLHGKTGQILKTAIHNVIKTATPPGYGSGVNKTWGAFYTTDRRSDNTVVDRYSNDVRTFGTKGDAIDGMNIEHSFPKSWWGGTENQAYKDLFNLMPCEANINSKKSNYAMGAVTNASIADNGCTKVGKGSDNNNYWEPGEQWKGDFARGYMYMSTAYQDFTWESGPATLILNSEEYPTLKTAASSLYIQWAKADDVSDMEVERNSKVQGIQGNRNPYVDFPNLMCYVWGDSIGVPFNMYTTRKPGQAVGGTTTTPTGEVNYTLVSDLSTLRENDKILIAFGNGNESRVTIPTGDIAGSAVTVTLYEGNVIKDVTGARTFTLKSTGNSTYPWAFLADDGYIGPNTADKAGITINRDLLEKCQAKISNGSIEFNQSARNLLLYNNSSNIRCYASSNTSYATPQIFRETVEEEPMSTVATPEFSVAEGEVEAGTLVSITCSTPGATIYYTTGSGNPDTEYGSPIAINAATTIKAIARKSGMIDSEMASATYTVRVTDLTSHFTSTTTEGAVLLANGSAGNIVGESWSSDFVTISHEKFNSSSNSNNDGSLIRLYQNDELTFMVASGYMIKSIEIVGISSDNYNKFTLKTPSGNGTVETTSSPYTWKWTSTGAPVSAVIKTTAQCRFTGINVTVAPTELQSYTIAQFYNTRPEGTFKVSGPMTVYYLADVDATNHHVYVTDGTEYLRIHTTGEATTLALGDVIISVTGQYNNVAGIELLATEIGSITAHQQTVNPTTITMTELQSLDKLYAYVRIEDVNVFNVGDEDNQVYAIYDLAGNSYLLYDKFYHVTVPTEGSWDVIGIVADNVEAESLQLVPVEFTANETPQCTQPTVGLNTGNHGLNTVLTFTNIAAGETVYFTLDGSVPSVGNPANIQYDPASPYVFTEYGTYTIIAAANHPDKLPSNPTTPVIVNIINMEDTSVICEIKLTSAGQGDEWRGNYPTSDERLKSKEVIWTATNGVKFSTYATIAVNMNTYPNRETNDLKLYKTNGNVVTMTAPLGYYFMSVSTATSANKVTFNYEDISVTTTKTGGIAQHTFATTVKATSFSFDANDTSNGNNSTFTGMTVKIAAIPNFYLSNPNTYPEVVDALKDGHTANFLYNDDSYGWVANHMVIADGVDHTLDRTVSTQRISHDRVIRAAALTDQHWQALYLPFDVDAATWSDFAETVITFSGVSETKDGEIELEFTEHDGTLEAHQLYIFRPKDSIHIDLTGDLTVEPFKAEDTSVSYDCNGLRYTLSGTYTLKTDMRTSKSYALREGNFMKATSDNAVLKPYRVYLNITEVATGNAADYAPEMAKVVVREPNQSGVEEVSVDAAGDVEYYDLQGRKVTNPTAGFYIERSAAGTRKVVLK